MANPPGTHLQHHNQDATNANSNAPSSTLNGTNPANGNPESSTSASPLKHNPGISNDWTAEEQSILEDGLAKYSSESNILRYAKIAMQLQTKTVRDVALRCRWMTKKESSKRRKDDNLARKSKDKKEKLTDASTKPSSFITRANAPAYTNTVVPIDSDDGISCKTIGGVTGDLLEQNALALSQITSNLSTMQIQENINLLCRTRDNILKIMNNLNDVPEVMKQMPPLPVKMNEELANTILPRPNIPMK
ncbi:unnamed protein product [Linum trigynum]|uniref:Myb-like domain-containing protein n=1 Tax=Linum trigynum TaxID=586398 RepID=A0AAV2G217_9ROSI